jgi:hypothetical protein
MSLASIGNLAWETIRGVRFYMLHGTTFITVLVTRSALLDVDHVAPEVGGQLACFGKHRPTFERVANTKHQRGLLDESGAVIIQAGT